MYDLFYSFISAFLISAVFTIPITMVTAKIIQQSIAHGFDSAISFIIGASIMEWVYTFLALILFVEMDSLKSLNLIFMWASVPVLIVLGIHHWKRSRAVFTAGDVTAQKKNMIWAGFTYNIFNFLILPFWLVTLVWLKEVSDTPSGYGAFISFSTGATLGAGLIFVLYAYLGTWISLRLSWIASRLDLGLAFVFIGLVVVQLFTLLRSS